MIIHFITVTLAIIGVHVITRDGMVFGFVERFWLSKGEPEYSRPLTECVICMASVWGSLYYITMVQDFFVLPGWIGAGSGIIWFVLAVAGAMDLISSNVDF